MEKEIVTALIGGFSGGISGVLVAQVTSSFDFVPFVR
jgi:hypothetical protein